MKNKYAFRPHISERKFQMLVQCFALDLTATQISQLTALSRNTINRYLRAFRSRLTELCAAETAPLHGDIEVDESYFRARRVKGQRGRGACGKTIVFGVFARGGKVHTEVVPNCSKPVLQQAIRGQVDLARVIHSDGWRGYNGLVDFGYQKHLRVHHGANEFVRGTSHINGLESFWGYAKTRLAKFKGVHAKSFAFHLKECEFRFNNRHDNLYKILLKSFRNQPLKLYQ